jgi:hypothetical protein
LQCPLFKLLRGHSAQKSALWALPFHAGRR